jgi:hypothetical protein
VSGTATDSSGQKTTWATMLLPLVLIALGGLSGCAEEPLPTPKVSREDCLRGLDMKQLKAAIARCDAVVAAFPTDPLPLNERFLLHTLNQDSRAACRDIVRANALARRAQPAPLDELLRQDLALRLASCQPRPTAAQQRSSH